jgi:hypothetical protein
MQTNTDDKAALALQLGKAISDYGTRSASVYSKRSKSTIYQYQF